MKSWIASFLVLWAAPAGAGCLSPVAQAGKIALQASTVQWSDGCVWNSTNTGVPGSPCSKTGKITGNGATSIQWCDGAHLQDAANSTSQINGSCSNQGTFEFDATAGWYQWCDGSNWRAMQAPYPTAAWTTNEGYFSGSGPASSVQTTSLGNTSSGNAIICSVQYDSSAVPTPSIANLTDTTNSGNVYQKIISHTASYTTIADEIWYAVNITGGNGFQVTVNFNNAVSGTIIAQCGEFSGLSTTNTVDQANYVENTTTAAIPSAVTSTSAKELLYTFVSSNGSSDFDHKLAGISAVGENPVAYFQLQNAGTFSTIASQALNTTTQTVANSTYYLVTLRSLASTTTPTAHTCQLFLTSGSSWTVPSDWSSSNNQIEVIGGGAGGASDATGGGGGGGAGGYSTSSNLSFTAGNTVSYAVGAGGGPGQAGGDTYFNGTSCTAGTICARGGTGGSGTSGGAGGLGTNGFGTNTKNGGYGNNQHSTNAGGGGGGSAGAANGKPTSSGTSQTGGQADGTNGGVGGPAGIAGTTGDEWEFIHSPGGGGGGGSNGNNGAAGGIVGGGGGGSGTGGIGGSGSAGVISLTWQGVFCQ